MPKYTLRHVLSRLFNIVRGCQTYLLYFYIFLSLKYIKDYVINTYIPNLKVNKTKCQQFI